MMPIERRYDLPPGSAPHLPLKIPNLDELLAGDIAIPGTTRTGSVFVELPDPVQDGDVANPYSILAVSMRPDSYGIDDPYMGRYTRTPDGDIQIVHDVPAEPAASDRQYPFAFQDKEVNGAREDYSGYLVEPLVQHAPGFDVQRYVDGHNAPILELNGPNPNGFYFLDGVELPQPPYVATESLERLNYRPEHIPYVDEVMDGRSLPFADGSVGMVLAGRLMNFYEHELPFTLPQDRREYRQALDLLAREADRELVQIATGQKPLADATISARAGVYTEVHRVLQDEGLFFIQGYGAADFIALGALGFSPVAQRYIKVTGIQEGRPVGWAEPGEAVFVRLPGA